MSETFEFERETTVEVSITVYDVQCKCGADLKFTASRDADDDIRIEVEEHVCIQEEE